MTREQIVAMSTTYFAAVDAMDVQSLRDLLTPDCVFIIESHGITYNGRDAIVGLFTARWKNPVATSKHDSFAHVADKHWKSWSRLRPKSNGMISRKP